MLGLWIPSGKFSWREPYVWKEITLVKHIFNSKQEKKKKKSTQMAEFGSEDKKLTY